MSTRCVVTCIEGYERFSVYRHSDGYPDGPNGVLATLKEALPFAFELPRFEPSDFAAAIVAAWKKYGGYFQGGDIRLTGGHENHGDLEYRYEITGNAKGLVVKTFEAGDKYTWNPVGKPMKLTAADQEKVVT